MDQDLSTLKLKEARTRHDDAFVKIEKLTWLPWVGKHLCERSGNTRLLVVGESHYYTNNNPEQTCAAYLKDRETTREMVLDCHRLGTTRTLRNLPKMLFGTSEMELSKFWAAIAYFNMVQRPLDHSGTQGERPTTKDISEGWDVFKEVVALINPTHCLFMGVQAAKHLSLCDVRPTQLVGRTWAREGDFGTMKLIFVQHPGRYFSWRRWHDYLQTQHPDLTGWLAAEQVEHCSAPGREEYPHVNI